MRPTDIFDNYLNGKLSAEEKIAFEQQLNTDAVFANAFNEHRILIDSIQITAERANLKQKLKSIHSKEFGSEAKMFSIKEETFAKRHGRTLAVAASTAIIAVMTTVAVLSTGGYLLKQQSNQITDLNRIVKELKASNDGIVEGITKSNKKASYAPANLEGSAFALNNNGFIITSFHMVNGADSIFVQNAATERSLTKLVFTDSKLDLAILQIQNTELSKNWQVPFSFKEKITDVGEKVFTLGFPRREMVYGEGSLSALSGYSNDTSMYQISIPVNPGNSGGPLLDEAGNVIGVIRGKISGAEATGFAIKSNEIIKSINLIEADSIKKGLLTQSHKKSSLRNLKRSEQIKRINPYVFNVLVYKKD